MKWAKFVSSSAMFAASDTDFIVGCFKQKLMKEEFDPQCWQDFRPQGKNNNNRRVNDLWKWIWTTVVFEWFPFTKWLFNTGQDNRNSSSGLSKGWPRPLNRGDRLIEVKITVIKGSNFRDFDNWPLNRGWPLNTGPLNTGSTVYKTYNDL